MAGVAAALFILTPRPAAANPATALFSLGQSSWTVDLADTVNTGGFLDRTHLALDGAGNPHIVYFDSNQFPAYAGRAGVTWTTSTVVADKTYDQFYALAVGSAGDPRVIYTTQPASGFPTYIINYATLSGGIWSTQVLDGSNNTVRVLRAITDASDDTHVLYMTFPGSGNFNLKYALVSGGTITTSTVASAANLQFLTADMTVDPSRNPHFSYSLNIATGTNQDDIYYVTASGGVYGTPEFVTSGYNAGMTAIALDPTLHPHICYIPPSAQPIGQDQSYASRGASAAEWTTETMLQTGDYMSGITSVVSLAIDAQGKPHVMLFDGLFPVYLTKSGVQWSAYPPGNAALFTTYGWPSKILLDSSGKPTVAFDHSLGGGVAQILYAKLVSVGGSAVGNPPSLPAGDPPINCRIFPSPYLASSGVPVTFDALPADALVRIVSMRGALVGEVTADGAGTAHWTPDGVPSGVYWVVVRDGGRSRTFKMAIQR